jgi:DNA-3-methyladenine glycosylase
MGELSELAEVLRGSAVQVAPRLLGATMTSEVGGESVQLRITEVEAYLGPDDPASHAFRGRSPRNAVMFGGAGVLYVYFVYGMHWCANVVCGQDGEATAVLLRAGEVISGADVASARRSAPMGPKLAAGPARLASCLGLTGADNGADLLDPASPIRLSGLLSAGAAPLASQGPRVGVSVAADEPWRFWVTGDPTVSIYRRSARAAQPK